MSKIDILFILWVILWGLVAIWLGWHTAGKAQKRKEDIEWLRETVKTQSILLELGRELVVLKDKELVCEKRHLKLCLDGVQGVLDCRANRIKELEDKLASRDRKPISKKKVRRDRYED